MSELDPAQMLVILGRTYVVGCKTCDTPLYFVECGIDGCGHGCENSTADAP